MRGTHDVQYRPLTRYIGQCLASLAEVSPATAIANAAKRSVHDLSYMSVTQRALNQTVAHASESEYTRAKCQIMKHNQTLFSALGETTQTGHFATRAAVHVCLVSELAFRYPYTYTSPRAHGMAQSTCQSQLPNH